MSVIEISYKSYHKFNMQQLEAHPYYELYFLINGNRTVFINEQSFNASANTLFFIAPNTLHKTIGNEPSERINIYISKELLNKSNLEFINNHANSHISLNEQTANYIKNFLINASSNDFVNETDNLVSTTNAVLFYLQAEKFSVSSTSVNQDLQKIVQFINEHFSEEITIERLCNKFFISKNSLFRLFHKNLQCTVIEYLLTLRLKHAKHLLTTSNLRIENIAEYCGFSSANYFSLIFKKKMNMSPLSYRKKCWQLA